MWSRCLKFYFFSRLTPSRSFLATGNEGSQKRRSNYPSPHFPARREEKKEEKGKKKKKKSSLVSSVAQKRGGEGGSECSFGASEGLANGFPEKKNNGLK